MNLESFSYKVVSRLGHGGPPDDNTTVPDVLNDYLYIGIPGMHQFSHEIKDIFCPDMVFPNFVPNNFVWDFLLSLMVRSMDFIPGAFFLPDKFDDSGN